MKFYGGNGMEMQIEERNTLKFVPIRDELVCTFKKWIMTI